MGKPTSEPFRFRVMDVKVWTEDVLNGDFLLKSQAVVFTCRVNRRQIREHVNIKCDSLQLKILTTKMSSFSMWVGLHLAPGSDPVCGAQDLKAQWQRMVSGNSGSHV